MAPKNLPASALQHAVPPNWQPANSEDEAQVAGTGFFQPQQVYFKDSETGVPYKWSSRRHRKGLEPKPKGEHASWKHQGRTYRLFGFDFSDISWWVAQLFLVGSVFWCVNGSFDYLGYDWTANSAFNAESATAFVGGTLFAFGGYLSWVEALNPAAAISFGTELRLEEQAFLHPKKRDYRGLGVKRRHFGRHSTLPADHALITSSKDNEKMAAKEEPMAKMMPHDSQSDAEKSFSPPSTPALEKPKWRWYGATPADWHNVGYVANTIQLVGAETFWISVLCGLPGILPEGGSTGTAGLSAKTIGLWDGLFWAPQVIGSPCFIISGIIFMLEEQDKWWKPKPLSMGWHVGLWNTLGGFGFLFSGVFGIARSYGLNGISLSTFWGSWCFLLGSYLQLLEGLNKR